MNSSATLAESSARSHRYSDVEEPKAAGSTYTPENLADFVATQIVNAANFSTRKKIKVLDPAVGDGALLEALVSKLPEDIIRKVEVFGYDTNSIAVTNARERLEVKFPSVTFHLEERNFLQYVLQEQNDDLLTQQSTKQLFDLVIANPPYVRTQIIGAQQAQQLAKSFGLTGRVDLYYPFILSISKVLSPDGIAGVITSNRFMTTKSGQSVRRALLTQFELLHVWDLGDTKLFDAAVLPSVFLARGTTKHRTPHVVDVKYTSIYEAKSAEGTATTDILATLSARDSEVRSIPDGRHFLIRQGVLDNGGDPEGVWRVATETSDEWMDTVGRHTWDTFRRIGKIRVGVKSTADKVFIRSDWDAIPGGRPELVRPLITRHCAQRFKSAIPDKPSQRKEILYPHKSTETGRAAVDLDLYPKSKKYLEEHRATLEARTYVIEAGRKWYEIWVPQDPSAWTLPKLVFPDISEKPIFWIDMTGGVVNGECYWLKCDRDDEQDLLWLALAIANSTFIEAFYDHRFNNKLYAGRRRFITQYVEQFPLPDPDREEVRAIVSLVKKIHAQTPSPEADELSLQLDKQVWKVFGLNLEEISR